MHVRFFFSAPGFRKTAGAAFTFAAICAAAFTPKAWAQNTATIEGTVKDSAGAVVPNANVTLLSETRGTTFNTTSDASGDFIFSNMPGDTYTLSVSAPGFKKLDRTSIQAVPGDRIIVPALNLELGNLNETIEVSAEAPLVQTATGERSAVVEQVTIQNVPVSGTFFAQMVALTPGVNSTSSNNPTRSDNTGNVARTNYVLDGVTSVNTGGNQPGINLNYDSIAEVKVLTNSYQAEYGRSSGLQVIGITKSGTNQFHGSLYDYEQHSGWNSNSWANRANGVPRAYSLSRNWGGTIGGPVGKPNRQNKLFWFLSEQIQPTTTGGAVNYFRVPTALERQGNFSQTTDNNGKLFNTITDPSSGLPCSSTSTGGCFAAGGVLGVIPQSRLYPLGLAILNQYPMPNANGLNYNLITVAPRVTQTNFQHVARGDWNASEKLRISGKYAGQNSTIVPVAGSIPGFNDRVTVFPALIVPSMTVVYTFTPSLIFEGSVGYTRGDQLGSEPIDPAANRCNTPGLCNFPYLFPNALNVPKGSYQERVLLAEGAPYYKNGTLLLQPDYTWGSRIANPPPNNNYPPFVNWQYTIDTNLGLTKIRGKHTIKGGFSSQNSVKIQNLGTQELGVLPIEGALNFGNNTNNPLDTGFGYANAALGVFQSYAQQNALIEGRYVYHNNDFYIQDNWRIAKKLTLDMGLRIVHNGPQYDSREQLSNFFPNLWQASQAPQLFQPGCAVPNQTPCSSANRVAINPVTGASLGAGSSSIIGDIVPGTGNPLNGIVQADHGIDKANYSEPFIVLGPRFGAAYALSENVVIRGAMGLFYDRPQGDAIYGQTGNPPTGQAATVYNSTLQAVSSGAASAYQAPPQMVVYNYNAAVPASFQFNIGTQVVLPWSGLVDVSYVQSYNYNTVAWGTIGTPAGYSPLDLNAPDLGTAYLPQYQDPTLGTSSIPGATALTTNLLRPYRGLGAIYDTWPRYNDLYSAIQMSYKRQYRNGITGGFNYTLGLRNSGNMLTPPILQHSNGMYSFSPVYAQNSRIINNVGFRRHTLKGYLVYELPKAHGVPKAAAYALNGWQLSVVYTGGSGAPYDVTYTYASNGSNVNLTGSPQYFARPRIGPGAGSGCGRSQYAQINADAFSGPTYNSIGNESGSSLFHYCFNNTTDFALLRSFHLWNESKILSFRLDAFNAFNIAVINAVNNDDDTCQPGHSGGYYE